MKLLFSLFAAVAVIGLVSMPVEAEAAPSIKVKADSLKDCGKRNP